MGDYHIPVLKEEVLRYLDVEGKNLIIDGTLGDGGHSEEILKQMGPQGRVLGIDQDLEALERAKERLKSFGDKITFIHGNFRNIKAILAERKIEGADGILLDLGVSSRQLDTPERGFSFMKNGPLDMRMNQKGEATAADLLENLSDEELKLIIKDYGEERHYKNIVHEIRKAQSKKPITTTIHLKQILSSAVKHSRPSKIHVATKTFQALRIAVNHELESLEEVLKSSLQALKPGGRMVVISFHSLEDRRVKNFFRSEAKGCSCPPRTPICICGRKKTLKVLTRKVVIPSAMEVSNNPRSSCAKLRAAERIYA
ncbi:MAG: 16S rRNA (cytosine(1402)-N(4))-methyltransferase RsmH [Nitrospinales bacterium]